MNINIKRQEISKVNNPTLHLKKNGARRETLGQIKQKEENNKY